MYYVTIPEMPRTHQITLEELLFGMRENRICSTVKGATRTTEVPSISTKLRNKTNVDGIIRRLRRFNDSVDYLRERPRQELYRTFYIPKSSGGLRRIDAPCDELMTTLRHLKTIFEESFMALHHTSAFAYVKERSTIDALKRHQANNSKWFGKYDLSDFFGSTTLEFVMTQFSMIYPFCLVMESDRGRAELEKALELAFLNGGLPQGTPISPLITNVMMIPIDYKLSKTLRDFEKSSFVYTRYADDFIISSKYDFEPTKVQELIVQTLEEFSAPFQLNRKKTRYGSTAGSNWNLGLMLNKDNEITVGYANKKRLQTMIYNFLNDLKKGVAWDLHDIQVMDGYINYYRLVERTAIDNMIEHINQKYQVDVKATIKEALG